MGNFSFMKILEIYFGSFNAKDPSHEGEICDYVDQEIDWLEGKPFLELIISSN